MVANYDIIYMVEYRDIVFMHTRAKNLKKDAKRINDLF